MKKKQSFIYGLLFILSIPCLMNGSDLDRLLGQDLNIVSKISGHYLDVYANKKNDGAFLVQFPNTNRANQLFKLIPASHKGFYHILAVQSNKYLDVNPEGGLMIQSQNGEPTQEWRIKSHPSKGFIIISKATGKAVTVKDSSLKSEAKIIVAAEGQSESQVWKIKPPYKNAERDKKLIGDANARCEFDEAIAAYEKAVEEYPDLDMESIISPAAHAAYFKLLEALGASDLKAAKARLEKLIEITDLNPQVKNFYFNHAYLDYLKYAVQERIKLGNIKPKHTLNILVVYAKRSHGDKTLNNGTKVEVRGEITREQMIMTDLFIGTLKNFMEISTNGNITVQIKKEELDSTITDFTIPKDNNPNHMTPIYDSLNPYPSQMLYDHVVKGKTDIVFWIFDNNVRMVCHGGRSIPSLFPFQVYLKSRGFVELMTKYMFLWDGCGLQLVYHEFLHAIESRISSPYIAVHFDEKNKEIWSQFGYKEMGKLETFSYQIRTFLPLKLKELESKGIEAGWNILSYSDAYPVIMSQGTFQKNLKATAKISYEERKKAFELKNQGDNLYFNKNTQEAISLYQQAIELNPALADYYRLMGDEAIKKKNKAQAIGMYKKYLEWNDNGSYMKVLADLLAEDSSTYSEAVSLYHKSIQYIEGKANQSRFAYEISLKLISQNKWEDVVDIAQRGLSLGDEYANLCFFLKGEALYRMGKKFQGEELIKIALEKANKEFVKSKSWMEKRYKNFK